MNRYILVAFLTGGLLKLSSACFAGTGEELLDTQGDYAGYDDDNFPGNGNEYDPPEGYEVVEEEVEKPIERSPEKPRRVEEPSGISSEEMYTDLEDDYDDDDYDHDHPEEDHDLDAGLCQDGKLMEIVDRYVTRAPEEPLQVARQIQEDAENELGGHYQTIVGGCEFAYVNWYSGGVCKVRHGDTHILVWKD